MFLQFVKSFFARIRAKNIDLGQVVFLDLETTGLFTNRCGILEVCLVNAQNEVFSTLVDAGQPIPARITEINGIDRDMIVGMPMFSEIASQVHDRIKDKIVVGHNVEFDLKFLFSEFLKVGLKPQTVQYICTCKTDRKKYGPFGNRLVDCLCRRGINVDQNHRAVDDVNMVRQLFSCQLDEQASFEIDEFDLKKFKAITLREPAPKFPEDPIKRSSHTLRLFKGWGDKDDAVTVSAFNTLISEACRDRIFDADEMLRLSELGIEKKAATYQLKKALLSLVSHYYADGKISWDEFEDLQKIATLFGFNSSVFFPLIKEVVPTLRVVCFTNELVVKGQVVDRYDILFPWAVRNGFLPSDSVTKQTDLVVNCGDKKSSTGKIEKARSYGIEVVQMSDFSKGKEKIITT